MSTKHTPEHNARTSAALLCAIAKPKDPLSRFIASERRDIEARQRHVLRHGSIDNQADLRTFCRLEGRLEQLLAFEAWLAVTAFVEGG